VSSSGGDPGRRAEAAALAALLLLAFALRAAWVLWAAPDRGGDLASDELWYYQTALQIAGGNGVTRLDGTPTAVWPPVYPALLAVVFAASGRSVLAAQLLNAFLGAATTLFCYAIGRRLFGARAGLLAAALFAACPDDVFYSNLLLSEPAFGAALSGLALLFVRLQQRRPEPGSAAWLLLGSGIGLAALTRGIGLAWPAVPVAVVLATTRSPRAALARAAPLLLGLALVLAPWTARNALRLGYPIVVASSLGRTLAHAHSPYETGRPSPAARAYRHRITRSLEHLPAPELEVALMQAFTRRSLGYMVAHPGHELRLLPARARHFFGSGHEGLAIGLPGGAHASPAWVGPVVGLADAYFFALLLLALAGMPRALRAADRSALVVPLTLGCLVFLHLVVFPAYPRYHAPLLPFLAVAAGSLAQPRAGAGRAARVAAPALVLGALACAPDPDAPPPHHLLSETRPIGIGAETRLATGAEAQVLLRRSFRAGESLPRRTALPAALAGAPRVLLRYRVWRDPGARAHAAPQDAALSVPVRVEGVEGARSVPLERLPELAGAPPFRLELSALPLPEGDEVAWRASLRVPRGGVLGFGYGLREELREAGAAPVRFAVRTQDREIFAATVDPRAGAGWLDARVDLSEHAGRELALGFSARAEGSGALLLPSWSDPVVFVPGEPAARPSLVVVSLDTLRAKSLRSYGHARDTAPFLEALAAEGSLFEQAITAAVTTSPSHMSLFTGLYPVRHGLVVGTAWKDPGAVPVAARLRAAGYHTAAFTENGYLIRRRGFGEGFEEYTENRSAPGAPRSARATFAQARRWLDRPPRAPFFLFVHTYEVHTPYAPREECAARLGAPGASAAAKGGALLDAYEAEIRCVDDELRALFEALRSASGDSDLVAVVTSDHGEAFGEHGEWQHGASLHEEALRVPLVLWGPGRIPAGRRIGTPVSLVDVAPTLLELAGVALPGGLDGRSLLPLLGPADPGPERTLFAEARSDRRWTQPLSAEPWSPPLVALRTAGRKIILHRPARGPALPPVAYDLAADPDERSPLPVPADEAARATSLVDRYLAGRGAPPAAIADEELGPELDAQLRELGYVVE
jgi:arylsulfatase A-like enzyme/4-amino-4-deoxy-L-arabinose transferase-like glycosyltransferase